MDKKKFEECIGGLFDAMLADGREKSQKLVEESLEKLKASGLDFSDPEEFQHLVYKLDGGVGEIANTMHDAPLKHIRDTHKPNFIYMHYDFLENNVRELCVLREGHSCCADKSRAILKMYLGYSLTGEIPAFNPNKENYWTPKFGTYEEWIGLCDGLYHLYYGKTEQYFKAYNALIQAEIRRYKHIFHTWYLRFKDGEVVEFDTTWDDKQKNPLDNEYFDKGDFYIMYKKYVVNRNYEVYEDEDLGRNYYRKVPKADIEEIYKISEEKMI